MRNEETSAHENAAGAAAGADAKAGEEESTAYESAEVEQEPVEAEGEPVETEGEPVEIQHAPVEVGLQRSVRYGRIFTVSITLGIILGAVVSLFFPVAEGANYDLAQIAGLSAVVGGVAGLVFAAIFSLFLGIIASRNRGAAIAVQTDVR